MLYFLHASIYVTDGNKFKVDAETATQLFHNLDGVSHAVPNLIIENHDTLILIPGEKIAWITFQQNHEANQIHEQIDEKWLKISQLTDIPNPEEYEWQTEGKYSYINDRKISDNPKLIQVICEIEALYDQLELTIPDTEEENFPILE